MSAMNGRTMRVECSVQLKDIDTKPFKEDIICSVVRGQPIPRYIDWYRHHHNHHNHHHHFVINWTPV